MLTTENYSGKAPYAAKATDGTNITAGAYGSYTTAKNNNGTIRANGTVGSGVVSSVKTVRPVVTTFASTVIEDSVTSKDYAGKAVSGGTFAHNHTKPIGALVSDELAGVSTDVVKSPGNKGDVIRSINKLETLRTRRFTTAVRANKYNRVTGSWASNYPVVATDTLDTDVAATPTLSAPGQLVYMAGSVKPVCGNDNNSAYKAKTNG